MYVAVVAALSAAVHDRVALVPGHPIVVIESVWRGGELVARTALRGGDDPDPRIDAELAAPGSELVHEAITAEGPILSSSEALLAISLVPGRDGVVARLDGREAFVTPDDILARRGYDRGVSVLGVTLPTGADTAVIYALLAERLGTGVPRLRKEARLRRFRVDRSTPLRPPAPWARADARSLTTAMVRDAAHDLARYLARSTKEDGRFRFLVDATTGAELPGYDWPRHAGATYFLAQAAGHFDEPELAIACLHAAACLRDRAIVRCGDHPCVGEGDRVDLGSAALTLVAFSEIARTGLDASYRDVALGLARFIRSQQRPDGEFMHEFDRAAGRPIDLQYLYYSGEATLALGRAYALAHDPSDLDGARLGLAHLVGPAWSFVGSRYYFGEEHWTCQAMAELWPFAPDPRALDFCARWQAYGRRMQYHEGETPYDADGAFGVGPFATPRLTPVASRCEAGLATLQVLRARHDPSTGLLEEQERRALALLVRQALRPGPVALMADPATVYGAMPGSQVDLTLRVDYVQHAGSAMIRWLDLAAARADAPP